MDCGYTEGKNYAINFPLNDGLDDASYKSILGPIISRAMESFSTGAVVVQCGADTLSGDRLGCYNLSLQGHADCVEFCKSLNIPMLVVVGGGYTLRDVPRCGTYKIAVVLREDVNDALELLYLTCLVELQHCKWSSISDHNGGTVRLSFLERKYM